MSAEAPVRVRAATLLAHPRSLAVVIFCPSFVLPSPSRRCCIVTSRRPHPHLVARAVAVSIHPPAHPPTPFPSLPLSVMYLCALVSRSVSRLRLGRGIFVLYHTSTSTSSRAPRSVFPVCVSPHVSPRCLASPRLIMFLSYVSDPIPPTFYVYRASRTHPLATRHSLFAVRSYSARFHALDSRPCINQFSSFPDQLWASKFLGFPAAAVIAAVHVAATRARSRVGVRSFSVDRLQISSCIS